LVIIVPCRFNSLFGIIIFKVLNQALRFIAAFDYTKMIKAVLNFYLDGFRTMPGWGKRLWLIIIIKLFILFAILKVFFFPDLLKRNFSNDTERGNYVIEQLIR
jgi:hypothetical protein